MENAAYVYTRACKSRGYSTSWAQFKRGLYFLTSLAVFITIFTLTLLKIIKANLESLQLLHFARDFNRDPKTISRLVRKFQRTGSVEDLPRTPTHRVTTRQQDRYIRLTPLRDRNPTARTTARTTIESIGGYSVTKLYATD